jgi:hypothetical protein
MVCQPSMAGASGLWLIGISREKRGTGYYQLADTGKE